MPQLTKPTESSLAEINIVPLVDVVLVLLIIFMITAPILQSGIQVDLPKTQTVKEIQGGRVVVTIDRAQLIYLGDNAVNIHELGAKARSQMHDPSHEPVYLRADETVPFGIVASVLDTLQQAGIQNVSVVTEPLTERPQSD
jgi:biopolymer transport protein ExbD/biopolymer transport protein TolR